MTQRQRKFAGVLIVLGVLVAYAVVVVSFGDMVLSAAPQWLRIVYLALAGVLWAVPAGFVIRWMQRPDDT